ncbi:hypothetical protein JB92DRAFT_2178515 [Gautieria morchelliformis]|nr:hypothetical protein JB92DRAFT_2178515 [Gautieria morchelliformis]
MHIQRSFVGISGVGVADITYLTLLGSPMIILNKLKATGDLMNERSANYSNRLYSAMKGLCVVRFFSCLFSG